VVVEQLLCKDCNEMALGRTASGSLVDLDDPLRKIVLAVKHREQAAKQTQKNLETAPGACPKCRMAASLNRSASPFFAHASFVETCSFVSVSSQSGTLLSLSLCSGSS
jgi:hypothetical protein